MSVRLRDCSSPPRIGRPACVLRGTGVAFRLFSTIRFVIIGGSKNAWRDEFRTDLVRLSRLGRAPTPNGRGPKNSARVLGAASGPASSTA
jgi:hypothetical protein